MEVLDDTEQRIVTSLNQALALAKKEGWKGNGAWTSGIKRVLCDLGHELGYDVCTNKCKDSKTPPEWPEWLFDLTWVVSGAKHATLNLPLIVESEWIPDGVEADFEKLMVSRADHRLMIFSENNPAEAEKRVSDLKDRVLGFTHHQEEDRFLFAVWFPDGKFGTFRYFCFQPIKGLVPAT